METKRSESVSSQISTTQNLEGESKKSFKDRVKDELEFSFKSKN
jgi:hypothetical protein